MKLSPAARKWVRGVVDYGGLVAFLIGFFLNRGGGMTSQEALVQATWWLVGGSALGLVVGLAFEKRIAPFPLIAGGAALVFGGLTLTFHSETFLKWKAPVVNWLFALGFAGSHFIGDRVLIKRIMGHALTLPDAIWTRLNLAWIAFFLFCVAANLFVAFTFQDFWVDFKVFGSLGMTVIFLVAQGVYLSRHLHDDPSTSKPKD